MAIFNSDDISLAPKISGYPSTYEDTIAYLRDIESYHQRDGILIPTTPENFISVDGDSNIYLTDLLPSLVRVDTEIVTISSESSGDKLLISDTVKELSLNINEDIEIFLDVLPPDSEPLDINLMKGTLNITFLNSSLSPDSTIGIDGDVLTIDGVKTGLNLITPDLNIAGNGIRVFTVDSNGSYFEYGTPFEEIISPQNVDLTDPQNVDLTDPILFSDDDLIVSEQEFDIEFQDVGQGLEANIENSSTQTLESLITDSDLYVIQETNFETQNQLELENLETIDQTETISIDNIIEISNLVDLGLQDEVGDLI